METKNRPGHLSSRTETVECDDGVSMHFDFEEYLDGWFWAWAGEIHLRGPFPSLEDAVADARGA